MLSYLRQINLRRYPRSTLSFRNLILVLSVLTFWSTTSIVAADDAVKGDSTATESALSSSPSLLGDISSIEQAEKDGPQAALLQSVTGVQTTVGQAGYSVQQAIPVSCLERDSDTGDHITDQKGLLHYTPFLICTETGLPLQLTYGVDEDITCTIDSISHQLFHILEYYLHNDVPLTCRIPSIPLSGKQLSKAPAVGAKSPEELSKVEEDNVVAIHPDAEFGIDNPLYTPLIFSLTGLIQEDHLHLSNNLNVIIHTDTLSVPNPLSADVGTKAGQPASGYKPVLKDGRISSATGYSSSEKSGTKLTIGDPLILHLAVHWYGPSLPSSSYSFNFSLSIPDPSGNTLSSFIGRVIFMLVGAASMLIWVSYRLSVGKPPIPGSIFPTGKLFGRSKKWSDRKDPILPLSSSDTGSSGKGSVPFRTSGYIPSPLSNSITMSYSSRVGKND